MEVRKATEREIQKILGHSPVVLKESTMGHIPLERKKAFDMVSVFLELGGDYLVCEENKVIQGWIGVGSNLDPYTDEVVGYIPEIFVRPRYRHQGVAERLCKEAIEHLKEEGYQKVQLNVFAGNGAKKLYQKLGFQDVSTLMERPLDSR